jgi:hypothetical protein
MAESNASYPDEPEMDVECPATADLWAAADEWMIEADGNITGEYDPEAHVHRGHAELPRMADLPQGGARGVGVR